MIYLSSNSNNVNVLYDDFINKLDNCQYACTLEKMNMKELKMKSKPWISRYVAKLIEHRNKLFKKKNKVAIQRKCKIAIQ